MSLSSGGLNNSTAGDPAPGEGAWRAEGRRLLGRGSAVSRPPSLGSGQDAHLGCSGNRQHLLSVIRSGWIRMTALAFFFPQWPLFEMVTSPLQRSASRESPYIFCLGSASWLVVLGPVCCRQEKKGEEEEG